MRRSAFLSAAGLLLLAAAYVVVVPEPDVEQPSVAADTFDGRVTEVVDGDTFRISSADTSIRVWGLDAPERDEAGYDAASAALARLIAGQTLTCRERDIDRYGRIVGQCFLPGGEDITAAMIETGTAQEYCRFSGNHYGTC